MNTLIDSPNLPQTLLCPSRFGGDSFHGVAVPAEPAAAEAFYQGLPSVGWAAQALRRQYPDADLDEVLQLGLETLCQEAEKNREQAGSEKDFESATLEKIQDVFEATHGPVNWPGAAKPRFAAGAKGQPLVMVVDDCPVTRFTVAHQLRKLGFETLVAADGAEALLLAPVYLPDLVLMDTQMRPLDGRHACQMLQRSNFTGRPPVIFLVDASDKEAIAQALAAGGADFLAKPFEPCLSLPRLRAQLDVRRLEAQLHQANHELYRACLTKERVLTRLAKDVRNPLVEVRELVGAIGGIQGWTLTDQQRELTAQARDNLDETLASLDDVLDISVLDQNSLKLTRGPRELASVLRLATWIYAAGARNRRVALRLDLPDSPLPANCDELHVQRVVEILLANALAATPEDSTVTLGARRNGNFVRVWVDDSGPGLPEAALQELSAPAGATSNAPEKRERELTRCRNIVRAHGGRIFARARPDGGAHVEFCLPAVETPVEMPTIGTAPETNLSHHHAMAEQVA
jgi:signal transduction histidine kinase